MDEPTISFLKRAYREYYFKHNDSLIFPGKIVEREFGYLPFGGSMVRHLSFRTSGELIAELVRQAPSSVYCSNATYSDPSLPMDEKGWIGAELIFDIDAGSIPSPCQAFHNWWCCRSCHKGGKGTSPAICPGCSGNEVAQVHWACRECLSAAKQHTQRLVDFLVQDFGLSESAVDIYFSGSRGYHVHADDERFATLGTQARAEIANYVRGGGLLVDLRQRGHDDNRLAAPGWESRVSEFMSARSSQPRRRQYNKLLEEVVFEKASLIDSSVTTDIHRIFRMPGTLHGDSGMLKLRVSTLDGFDPFTDPVVLSEDSTKLHVGYSPEFTLKDHRFGPYSSADAVLPAYAAVFLLARGLGSVDT